MVQIREEVYFTKGRIIVRGKLVTRGKAKKADYVLYYKPNIPIALIEAKDNSHSVGDGMQQALDYAETLNIPFVFSSNGDGFVFHDRTGASTPRESNLARRLSVTRRPVGALSRLEGLDGEAEEIVLQDYHDDGSGKEPRYYQVNAVNAAIEAIAKGQDRVLLVMATGTGKTYTAFQIIWRLWKAGRKKRILFLADRNVLIDQTMVNDFRPFGGRWPSFRPTPRPSSGRTAPRGSDPGARQEAPHRHRLRGLSRPLSGHHRAGGAPEAVPRVLARTSST
jgi:type I restriction enzyme, R subunit